MKHCPYYDITYYDTLRDALVDMGRRYGDKPAVTWYDRAGGEHTHSYEELLCQSAAIARALSENGLAGRHVAIASENCFAWLCAFWGITAAGGVAVLIDIDQAEDRLCSSIARGGAQLVIASNSIAPLVRRCVEETGARLVCVEEYPNGESLGEFMGKIPSKEEALALLARFSIQPGQTAAIAYTSGTSSLPKPVMLTHSGLARNASESIAMVRPSERVFSSLPLYHTYGLTCGALCILFSGARLGINGDVKRMARDLMLFDPQIMMAVPLMVEMLYKRVMLHLEQAGGKNWAERKLAWFDRRARLGICWPVKELVQTKEQFLGQLRQIVCGGAHLSHSVALHMEALGVVVLEGYGITECSPLVSVNRLCQRKRHSVGKPLPSYQVRVEQGEILVRGPSLMQGYYQDPQATKEVMDGEWFRTGDMGRLDRHGFLMITGRKKNLIVLKNGKKIAPEEIEGYVMELPLVKEVVAHSAPSGDSADDVRLAVTVYPDEAAMKDMTAYEVLERIQRQVDDINSRLPAYKQIQMVNLRTNEFDKTASHKIKR